MSAEDVIHRWHEVFNGTLLTRSYLNIESRAVLSEAQLSTMKATVKVWRKHVLILGLFSAR